MYFSYLMNIILCLYLLPITVIHPRNFSDIPRQYPSGLYRIFSEPSTDFSVYCDMETAGGGWTVFQSRVNGSVDFYQNWTTNETGFGNLNHEFWLGNKNIASITGFRHYRLHIPLEYFEGKSRYVEYDTFSVGDAGYILNINGFSGNTGDINIIVHIFAKTYRIMTFLFLILTLLARI